MSLIFLVVVRRTPSEDLGSWCLIIQTTTMIKNYLKTAFRNLVHNRNHAMINIAGLATGVAVFILLVLYSVNEFSFDRFHKNEKNIYCVYDYLKGRDGSSQYTAITAMPLGPTMKKDMPDVVNYVRLKQMPDQGVMRVNTELRNVKLSFADSQFFSVFTFPL